MASGRRRFALQGNEALLCVADVRADTPSVAGSLRRVRVTDRRVALCRVPGAAMGWTAVILIAAAVQSDGSRAGSTLWALLIALVALRQMLPFRSVEREAPAAALRDVTQTGRALLLWFEDGSLWRLGPTRAVVDLGLGTSPAQAEALRGALARLLGRGAMRPARAK